MGGSFDRAVSQYFETRYPLRPGDCTSRGRVTVATPLILVYAEPATEQ